MLGTRDTKGKKTWFLLSRKGSLSETGAYPDGYSTLW